MSKYLWTSVIFAVLGIFCYFAVQKSTYAIYNKVYIEADMSVVFDTLKDPANLPKINPKCGNVDIKQFTKDAVSGVENRQYEYTVDILPFGGPAKWALESEADPKDHVINIDAKLTNGIISGFVSYMLKPIPNKKMTAVTEETTVSSPWILKVLLQTTARREHLQLLNAAKALAETMTAD